MVETEPKELLLPESNHSVYQPPRIESVQTSEEIERDVLYAGGGGSGQGG